MSLRFTVVEDPCGLFFIWDEQMLEPAMLHGDVLAFPRHQSAARIAKILNARADDEFGRRSIGRTIADLAGGTGEFAKQAPRQAAKG